MSECQDLYFIYIYFSHLSSSSTKIYSNCYPRYTSIFISIVGLIILLFSWFLPNAGDNQIYVSTPNLELLAWTSNGILDVSSWKSLWLNMSETDLHTPHPNQTCCFSYIPFLGNWPHHPLSHTSQMLLGVVWTLPSPPLPTIQQSPPFCLSWPPHSGCHRISLNPQHLLPGRCSGLPAPYIWSTLLPEDCSRFPFFLFLEKVYIFGSKLNFLKNVMSNR